MKYPPVLISAFRPPKTGRAPYTVNYLEGFWIRLFWDILISVRSLKYLRSGVSRSSRPPIKALSEYPLSFKRAAFILAAGSLINFSLPRPAHIVYADPIISLEPVKQLALLPMPALSPFQPLETLLHPLSSGMPNSYVGGQCTWYVASRLPVPQNWGNAINWGYAAAAVGYTVSPVPKVGAIAWSTNDYYLGHVAIVSSVTDVVTVSEMNYNGPYVVDERTANPGEFQYIYF